jgi:alcohol dehydrogenase class IV
MTKVDWRPGTDALAQFVSPSFISSGRGAASQVAALLSSRFSVHTGTVLVAADDIVLSSGLAKGLLDGLVAAGFEVVTVSGFGSEPTDDVVDGAAQKARDANARVVVGIGGGSVLDSSKLLSLLMLNEGGAADWLGSVEPPNGLAPLLLIPTTCGTGSEATRIAMLTVDGGKRASVCDGFIPDVVVIDPDLVASLPGSVVASTAMDALAHGVESLMSTGRSPMSSHHALAAIDLIVSHIEAAAAGDQDALAQCLWGSHLAGQALNAGVVVGHSLAYCLAYERPMPHGVSCALALPYCIAYNSSLDPALGRTLAKALTRGASSDLRVAAQSVFDLAKRLGLPTTLKDVDIDPAAAASIAHRVANEYPRPNNPEPLDETRLASLVGSMATGNLDAAFDVLRSAA